MITKTRIHCKHDVLIETDYRNTDTTHGDLHSVYDYAKKNNIYIHLVNNAGTCVSVNPEEIIFIEYIEEID